MSDLLRDIREGIDENNRLLERLVLIQEASHQEATQWRKEARKRVEAATVAMFAAMNPRNWFGGGR